jgi:hypothetical protein
MTILRFIQMNKYLSYLCFSNGNGRTYHIEWGNGIWNGFEARASFFEMVDFPILGHPLEHQILSFIQMNQYPFYLRFSNGNGKTYHIEWGDGIWNGFEARVSFF